MIAIQLEARASQRRLPCQQRTQSELGFSRQFSARGMRDKLPQAFGCVSVDAECSVRGWLCCRVTHGQLLGRRSPTASAVRVSTNFSTPLFVTLGLQTQPLHSQVVSHVRLHRDRNDWVTPPTRRLHLNVIPQEPSSCLLPTVAILGVIFVGVGIQLAIKTVEYTPAAHAAQLLRSKPAQTTPMRARGIRIDDLLFVRKFSAADVVLTKIDCEDNGDDGGTDED